MSRYDFRTPRLYVEAPLYHAAAVQLAPDQANHLVNVLRLKSGDSMLVFNGQDGEWRAALVRAGRRSSHVVIGERAREQVSGPDLHYLFAPLKHARMDYVVQKAVEMGASRLQALMTRHVQATRVNLDRMRANSIEAAQQCGILRLPEIAPAQSFKEMIAARDPERLMIFCDEDAPVTDPIAVLSAARLDNPAKALPLAVLIGPEGGFADDERASLNALANTIRLSLGPRILRADTAAVAALALVGAVLGDWKPARAAPARPTELPV